MLTTLFVNLGFPRTGMITGVIWALNQLDLILSLVPRTPGGSQEALRLTSITRCEYPVTSSAAPPHKFMWHQVHCGRFHCGSVYWGAANDITVSSILAQCWWLACGYPSVSNGLTSTPLVVIPREGLKLLSRQFTKCGSLFI